MTSGFGDYTYEVVQDWGRLPDGWRWGEMAGVAVDSRDRVYFFVRTEHPVMVFDRDGNFLTSWGEGIFTRAHGITIGSNDIVYCADDKDHTVRKLTTDGKLLQTLGTAHRPSDTGYDGQNLDSIRRGGPPFNRPTKLAIAANGDWYITDGYGNARVHKFAPDGTHLLSWGEPGTGQSQFRLPHAVWVDRWDRVLVADRENSRIQIFSPSGEFLTQWTDLVRPTDIFIDENDVIYVSELANRVSILDLDGNLLSRFGGRPGEDVADQVPHSHTLALDSHGDIYVGGVQTARRPKKFVRNR